VVKGVIICTRLLTQTVEQVTMQCDLTLMAETLYRKYRPRTFGEVVGQAAIKSTLQQEIVSKKLAHAYLFCGPRGVGKTTLARILAKALNCENRTEDQFEPDNECESCVAINEGRSLNLIEVDAASHRGINEIRDLRENVKFVPQNAEYKIFIIDEVHMLTTEAFNALLKTLEEPPAHAIFILATTEVHKLPDTIISRCQRFDFKKLPPEDLKKRLVELAKKEGAEVAEDVLDTLILRAEGCGRDAESILGQLLASGEKVITWDQAQLVLPRSDKQLIEEWITSTLACKTERSLEIIAQLLDEGVDLERFAHDTVMMIRTQMMDLIADNKQEEAKSMYVLLDMLIKRIPDIRKMTELPQLPLELIVIAYSLRKQQPAPVQNQAPQPVAEQQQQAATPQASPDGQPQENTQPPQGPGAAAINEPLQEAEAPPQIKPDDPASKALSIIQMRWEELLDYIQQNMPSLSFVLGVADPLKVEGETITVGFKYAFHQDIVNNAKNKSAIQEGLQKVFGIAYHIETVSVEKDSEEKKDKNNEDIVAIAAEAFEGDIADV